MEHDKITLKHPFEFEGKKIEKVMFKKDLKAKHILVTEDEMQARGIMTPGDGTRTFYLVSVATGIEPEPLGEMHISDYLKLAGKAGNFL